MRITNARMYPKNLPSDEIPYIVEQQERELAKELIHHINKGQWHLVKRMEDVNHDWEDRMSITKKCSMEVKPLIRCKDCKYFHYDKPYVVFGVPVLGHEVCDKWGDGCKTSENGFCFMAERRGEEDEN